MALGNRPSFSEVRSFFGGPVNLSAYVRGGSWVPNIPANSAISTTVAGLKLSQFSGADKAAPVVPLTAGNHSVGVHGEASSTGSVGAWASFDVVNNGWIRGANVNVGTYNIERWATAATDSYSARVTLVSGSASFFTATTFNTWIPITAGGVGATMAEHYSNVVRNVVARIDIALTSNTNNVLKSITGTLTSRYNSEGGGVIQ